MRGIGPLALYRLSIGHQPEDVLTVPVGVQRGLVPKGVNVNPGKVYSGSGQFALKDLAVVSPSHLVLLVHIEKDGVSTRRNYSISEHENDM